MSLARQVEPRDLHPTVLRQQVRLDAAAAHRIEREERIAHAVERLSLVQRAPPAHDALEREQVVAGQAARQTQLARVALAAPDAFLKRDDVGSVLRFSHVLSLGDVQRGGDDAANRSRAIGRQTSCRAYSKTARGTASPARYISSTLRIWCGPSVPETVMFSQA